MFSIVFCNHAVQTLDLYIVRNTNELFTLIHSQTENYNCLYNAYEISSVFRYEVIAKQCY